MKMKVPYNIRKSLFKLLPMALLMGTPAMNSCKPEDGPGSNPGSGSGPQIAIHLTWFWNDSLTNAPSQETVQTVAANERVSNVFINVQPRDVPFFTAATFHAARDTLHNLININPDKIKGHGEIRTNPVNGASFSFPDPDRYGMAKEDSLWFVQNGWRVYRLPYTK